LRTKQEETERKELIKKGQKQEKRMKTKIERSYIRSETKEKHTGKKKTVDRHNSSLLHSHLVRKKNRSSPRTIASRHQ
jgi:hypothetical protein